MLYLRMKKCLKEIDSCGLSLAPPLAFQLSFFILATRVIDLAKIFFITRRR